MTPVRPDLSGLPETVKLYILSLETEIENLRNASAIRAKTPRTNLRSTSAASANIRSALARAHERFSTNEEDMAPLEELNEPAEPETTIQVITVSANGIAKRTPRHLYTRQRRGGMGVFDLDNGDDDPPALLTIADESQHLLLLTNLGRAFRLPVSTILQGPVHARGESIVKKLNLADDEKLTALLTDQAQGYVALAGHNGMIRLLRHHIFGEHMKPGTPLLDLKQFGQLAAACRTPGDGDIMMITQQGKAIRFSEKTIPPQGGLGIKLTQGDRVVSITPVKSESGVFLLSADGKGTVRQMEGFAANKSPGASGKIAINTDRLVGGLCVDDQEDIFIISHLGKIIRFRLQDVPQKDGVVQGVICMSLRGDAPVAITVNPGDQL